MSSMNKSNRDYKCNNVTTPFPFGFGVRQSPIDININSTTTECINSTTKLHFSYSTAKLKSVGQNGEIYLTENSNQVQLDGLNFTLSNDLSHFHSRSEHFIEGHDTQYEVHLVHQLKSFPYLLVVSRLVNCTVLRN